MLRHFDPLECVVVESEFLGSRISSSDGRDEQVE